MSKTNKTAAPGARSRSRSQRPFDAIVIALSASLLVIFGIVIGRFIVTTQAVEVVDHFDEELSTLRAQVVELNRQLLQVEAHSSVAETRAANFQRQAEQLQHRVDQLVARQDAVHSALKAVIDQRGSCLRDVQQYVALDQSIPALDVLRFAETMFDAHAQTLRQLTDQRPTTPATTTALRFAPRIAPETAPVAKQVNATASEYTEYPALPAPAITQTSAPVSTNNTAKQAEQFFSPPAPRKPPAGYIFFAPRRHTPALTMPRRSGITFHDTAEVDEPTVRR